MRSGSCSPRNPNFIQILGLGAPLGSSASNAEEQRTVWQAGPMGSER
jgi:hypothetical protein